MGIMRLLITFTRTYPWQSLIMLAALLLAGVAGGISVSALLPLLSVIITQQTGAATPLQATRPEAGVAWATPS